jgi:hypothetical protein
MVRRRLLFPLAPGAVLALALLGGGDAARAQDAAAAFPSGTDPRTAGGPTSPDELGGTSLTPHVGSPDRGFWASGEAPDGRVHPHQALHGMRAEAGLHLELPAPEDGVVIAIEPRVTIHAPAVHEAAPTLGGAVAEHVAVPLHDGLRLRLDAAAGDRASLGLPGAPGGGHLAERLSVGIEAEIPMADGRGPLEIQLGVSSTEPLGPRGPDPTPGPCQIDLEAGRGSTHLHLGARCAGTSRGDTQVFEFGIRREF